MPIQNQTVLIKRAKNTKIFCTNHNEPMSFIDFIVQTLFELNYSVYNYKMDYWSQFIDIDSLPPLQNRDRFWRRKPACVFLHHQENLVRMHALFFLRRGLNSPPSYVRMLVAWFSQTQVNCNSRFPLCSSNTRH